MPDIPVFGKWLEKDHQGEKQEKAIKKAKMEETTPVCIDRDAQTAVFWGSGKEPYQTSLSSCTCNEFLRYKVPCKHIYRLAMELGILASEYKTGMSKGERLEIQISLEDAHGLLTSLSPNAYEKAVQMLSLSKSERHVPHLVTDQTIIEEFRKCPLMVENQFPAEEILRLYEREDLYHIIEEAGVEFTGRKNAAREKVLLWMVENIPSLEKYLPAYASFSFVLNFDIAQYKLLKLMEAEEQKELLFSPGNTYDIPNLPGLVFTVNGIETETPVIWFSGNVREFEQAVKAIGGRWSEKRGAWYLKIRKRR